MMKMILKKIFFNSSIHFQFPLATQRVAGIFFQSLIKKIFFRYIDFFQSGCHFEIKCARSSGSPSGQLAQMKNYTPFSPSRWRLRVAEWAEPLLNRRGVKASGRAKEAGGGVLPVFAQTRVEVSAETLAAYICPSPSLPLPPTTPNHTGPKPRPPTNPNPHAGCSTRYWLVYCANGQTGGRAGGRADDTHYKR